MLLKLYNLPKHLNGIIFFKIELHFSYNDYKNHHLLKNNTKHIIFFNKWVTYKMIILTIIHSSLMLVIYQLHYIIYNIRYVLYLCMSLYIYLKLMFSFNFSKNYNNRQLVKLYNIILRAFKIICQGFWVTFIKLSLG